MAGDWIKMRSDMYRDPKVSIIADMLMQPDGLLARSVNDNCRCDMTVTRNVMRNVTVGALVSVWGVMRQRGKRDDTKLVLRSATLAVIDDVADIPGFGDAMQFVGWVIQEQNGLVFPNFFEDYNVDPNEESKAKNAERQRRYREKLRAESDVTQDVTVASQRNARVEKSRVEKKKTLGATAPTKGSRISADWALPDDWAEEAKRIVSENRKAVEIKREAEKFRDFWVAKAGKDGAKLDWLATWRNWIRNACERAPAAGLLLGTLGDDL